MPFGLWNHCPDEVAVAWGARLIVERNHEYQRWLQPVRRRKGQRKPKRPLRYTVSVLGDRQDWRGTPELRLALSTRLNKGPLKKALAEFEEMFDKGILEMLGRSVVTVRHDGIIFVASPNSSGGYLYVVAWEEQI